MFLVWCVFSYWQLINSRYLKHHYVLWVVAHSTLGSLILIFSLIGIALMEIDGFKGLLATLLIFLLLTLATTGIWNLTQKCSPKWSLRPFKILQLVHRVISSENSDFRVECLGHRILGLSHWNAFDRSWSPPHVSSDYLLASASSCSVFFGEVASH